MPLPSTGYLTTTVAAAPSSDLTDFSWLVDLSQFSGVTDFWTACTSSVGLKLRCALDSDETELPFDVWDFDNVGATGYLRIKVPTFTSAGAQTLRIYPSDSGNADYATPSNAYSSVWAGYWTLSDDFNDRTGNANHLTGQNGITAGGDSLGQVGSATVFTKASSHFALLNSALFTTEPATMLAWCKPVNMTGTFDRRVIASHGNGSNYDEQVISAFDGSPGKDAVAAMPDGGAHAGVNGSSVTITLSGWHFIAGQFDDDSTRVYGDGTFGTANTTATTPTTNTKFAIGSRARFGISYFDGSLQHVAVFSDVLADEWIEQEYSQTSNNAAFWGAGTWNAAGGGGLSIPVARHHYSMQLQGAF